MKLSVIIPAYNEQHRIAKTLFAANEFLQKQSFDYEILVVVDGALDATSEVVAEAMGKIAKLRLIDNKENHGKGWAVKQGMLEAVGDVRVFMDADNSTKIDEIRNFLPFFEKGFDIVIGSRRISGSNIAKKQPWIRDLQGSIFRLIVHMFVPLGVTDSQCGFKAFSARAANQIFPLQRIYRWAFDVEILAIARKFGFKIRETPITWVNDEESQVKFSGKVKMLFEVLQIRLNLWLGKYGRMKNEE